MTTHVCRWFVAAAAAAALGACANPGAPGAAPPGFSSATKTSEKPVTIAGFAYLPKSITIAKGTTVIWNNEDDVEHTVTSNDNLFGSPYLRNGKTWLHAFVKAGTYAYHCKIHKYMHG